MALYLGLSHDGVLLTSEGHSLYDVDGVLLGALPQFSKWKINLDNIAYHLNIDLKEKESE